MMIKLHNLISEIIQKQQTSDLMRIKFLINQRNSDNQKSLINCQISVTLSPSLYNKNNLFNIRENKMMNL